MKNPAKARTISEKNDGNDGKNMNMAINSDANAMQSRHIRWDLPLNQWSVAQPAKIVPTMAKISNTATDHAASSIDMPRDSVRNFGPQSRMPILMT